MDYQNDIRINENALDVEFLRQPELALQYGIHWAEKQKELTKAEEHVKITTAELVREANENPEVLGGSKATIANVEAYYRTHPDHIAAKERWITAQYEANVADIARKEIGLSRKAALQALIELHNASYFAGPSVPRNLSNEVAGFELQKRTDASVASKLQRKKV